MLAIFVVLGAVGLDQLTKILIRAYLPLYGQAELIPGIVRLRHIENAGASFGMLDNARWVFLVVSVIAIAALIAVIIRFYKRHPLLIFSLSLILAGGVGNMIDRLFYTGADGTKVVTDFIEFEFVRFAVFNVADICITCGTVLLMLYIILIEPKIEKKLKADAGAARRGDDPEAPDASRPENGANHE